MDQNQTKEPRPPINLRIKFRSENVEQFIERYAVDVSRGGIFIRTRDPLAVGTHLKLDFQFQNGSALMSGEGTVVWIREFDPNRTTVPPGMGVRFDKLSTESQAVLEKLLVEKAKREKGGVPGSSHGTGGIAVRRPSSMFSVLEPQVSVADGAPGDKDAASTTATTPPAAASAAAGAQAAPKSGAAAAKTEASAYRPLGTARNPFSSTGSGGTPGPTATGTGSSPATPAPATPGSGPRPLTDLLPLFAGTPQAATTTAAADSGPGGNPASADADGSFDDLNEEPTQIAGRLPSFLMSDSEATTEVPADLAASVKTAAPLPLDFLPGASPDSARPGARGKQSLDEAPPAGATANAPPAAKTEAPKSDGEAVSATESASAVPPLAADAEKPAAAPATTAATPGAPAKKRSALPVVATVVVLGASAIFLSRFFGSQSSEDVTRAPSAPAGMPVITGEPAAVPSPPVAEPAPAPPAEPAPTAQPPAAEAPAAQPVPPPAEAMAEVKPASPADPTRKTATKKKVRAEVPEPVAEPAAAGAAATDTAPATASADPADAAPAHQIRVTSRPNGADVTLDGQSVGKTPFSVGITDVDAPHSISVRKEGFEPFEQTIGASSAWSKTKGQKGKPPLMVLKLNARLKPVGGAAEAKTPTEPPAAQEGDNTAAAKPEAAKPDRPLPPTDVTPPGDSPPPP